MKRNGTKYLRTVLRSSISEQNQFLEIVMLLKFYK